MRTEGPRGIDREKRPPAEPEEQKVEKDGLEKFKSPHVALHMYVTSGADLTWRLHDLTLIASRNRKGERERRTYIASPLIFQILILLLLPALAMTRLQRDIFLEKIE